MGKKIEVPQELQEQIVDAYVNKKWNNTQIKRELNLPFSTDVVKRILTEHGVYKKGKGGCKKVEISKEIQQQVIDAYNKGWGLDKIVKELNLPFSFDKARSILQDNGINIRNNKEAYEVCEKPNLRKYNVNDDYVLESHNGAWLLGMFAADGYLPITNGASNRLVLSLQSKDRDVLEMIAKELEYEGSIHEYEGWQGFPFVSLAITSKKLRQQFEKYGIVNAKTFKLYHLPDLPKEYMLDFIRGFFDGDGSIFEREEEKKVNSSFCCACKSFLEEIAQFLHDEYGFKIPTISEDVRHQHVNYSIRYYKADTLKLGSLFYDNDYLALPRKKNFFFKMRDKYEW